MDKHYPSPDERHKQTEQLQETLNAWPSVADMAQMAGCSWLRASKAANTGEVLTLQTRLGVLVEPFSALEWAAAFKERQEQAQQKQATKLRTAKTLAFRNRYSRLREGNSQHERSAG